MFPTEFLPYCPLVVQARQATDKPVNASQIAKCDFRPAGSCLQCKTCNYVLHAGVHPNSMGARFMAALRTSGKFSANDKSEQPAVACMQTGTENGLTLAELLAYLQQLQSRMTAGPWVKWRLSPDSDEQERCIIVDSSLDNEILGIVTNDADVDLIVTLVAHLPVFMELLHERVASTLAGGDK